MSNLLFFHRSLATRHAAVETMRRARAMPPGPERHATRRLARALGDLAKTEAWLEGQAPGQRTSAYECEHPGCAAGSRVWRCLCGNRHHFLARIEPRREWR